jgi:hypothetical protein
MPPLNQAQCQRVAASRTIDLVFFQRLRSDAAYHGLVLRRDSY